MTELRTRRLILRPIEPVDVDALHRFWTDPEVRRYLFDDEVISRERVTSMIQSSAACFRDLGAGFFAIHVLNDSDQLAGFCGFRRFEQGDQPELLYGILPGYWGEGYVTEAARAVLRHGFADCGMERVIAATDTPNQSSVRVMQRLGMIFHERRQYRDLDTVFYSLSIDEFQPEA